MADSRCVHSPPACQKKFIQIEHHFARRFFAIGLKIRAKMAKRTCGFTSLAPPGRFVRIENVFRISTSRREASYVWTVHFASFPTANFNIKK